MGKKDKVLMTILTRDLASCLLVQPSSVMGRITNSIAFSWTCQPSRNEVQAHSARHLMNWLVLEGQVHSLARAGSMASRVRTAVVSGEMLGRTECWMSCTSPPVMEAASVPVLSPACLPRTERILSAVL